MQEMEKHYLIKENEELTFLEGKLSKISEDELELISGGGVASKIAGAGLAIGACTIVGAGVLGLAVLGAMCDLADNDEEECEYYVVEQRRRRNRRQETIVHYGRGNVVTTTTRTCVRESWI